MAVPEGAQAELDAAVDELYGMAPEGFLGRRAALAAAAKAAGDTGLATAIGALRKPTVAAWAVNLLARRHPGLTAELAGLAERLREAQERLDGAALLELGRERSALVDRLVAATTQTVTDAGGRLTPAAAQAAGTTFVAACADPAATAAVTSGRLTRALEYAGFGEVDLHEATARPLRLVRGTGPDGAGPTPAAGVDPAQTDEPPAAAEEAALAGAEGALHEAMSAATAATSRHGVLGAELELAETRVAQLQTELARARAHRDQTADALAEAELAQAAAQRELRRARAAVEDARGD